MKIHFGKSHHLDHESKQSLNIWSMNVYTVCYEMAYSEEEVIPYDLHTMADVNVSSSSNLTRAANRAMQDGDVLLPFPRNIVVLGVALGAFIIILGTVGNILVILSVFTYKSLSRFSNVFVVSLAAWDLLQNLCVRPLYVHTYVAGEWVFGEDTCRYALVLSNLSILESIIHVTVIALYRYAIIVHPLRARCLLRRRSMLSILLAMYLLPLSAVLIPTLSSRREIVFNKRIMFCSFVRHNDFRLSGVLKKVLFLGLNAGLLLFFYVRIVQTVRSSRRSVHDQGGYSTSRIRKEMMLLKTVITMFISFILTFLPLSIVYGIDTARTFPYVVYFIGVVLLWSSSSINWIIYGCVHKQYCAAYTYVLCQKTGCKPLIKTQTPHPLHDSHSRGSSFAPGQPNSSLDHRLDMYGYRTMCEYNHRQHLQGGPAQVALSVTNSPLLGAASVRRHPPLTRQRLVLPRVVEASNTDVQQGTETAQNQP